MANEIVPVEQEQYAAAIFDTSDPRNVIDRAASVAKELMPLVEKAKLFSMIQGKKYVKAEGWTTMLAMLGVFPQVEYCRKLNRTDELAYEARVLLTTVKGAVIGAGEAICSSLERNWSNRDEFAIKSMAQTRATGKAARIGFSWIMSLAGYEPTPAEEMVSTAEEAHAEPPRSDPSHQSSTIVTYISDVKAFRSKKGTEYFKFFDDDAVPYATFDRKVAEAAKLASEAHQQVELTYTTGEYGPKVTAIRVVG